MVFADDSPVGQTWPERAMYSFEEPEVWRGILESLSTGLCVLDMQKRIVLWSDGAERITGHLRHEVIGHSCISEPLLHCDQPGCEFCSEECPLARAMKTSHPITSNALFHHKAGHEIPVCTRAVPVHNQHGSIIGAAETFEDVQSVGSARISSIMQPLESLDAVTSTASRAILEMHLTRALIAFQEAQVPCSILLLKIENLARFRSSFGKEAASLFLRLVARTVESVLWNTDDIGRWEDDHFMAVLNGCAAEALPSVRERVRRTIAREGIEWWGERHSLPVSIGEAAMQDQDTVPMLLERAQTSLDAASAWLAGATGANDNSPEN